MTPGPELLIAFSLSVVFSFPSGFPGKLWFSVDIKNEPLLGLSRSLSDSALVFLSESKCRRQKLPCNLTVWFLKAQIFFFLPCATLSCSRLFFSFLRGWGLRCLDDIPMGTFVCTYAGQILNEDMANKVLLGFPCDYLSRSSLN